VLSSTDPVSVCKAAEAEVYVMARVLNLGQLVSYCLLSQNPFKLTHGHSVVVLAATSVVERYGLT
jgi:hypothetical protein